MCVTLSGHKCVENAYMQDHVMGKNEKAESPGPHLLGEVKARVTRE